MMQTVKIFLLGMLTASVFFLALRGPATAVAGNSYGAGEGVIAVASANGGRLFLIDPEEKYVAVYGDDSAGQFMLQSARFYRYDLRIGEFRQHNQSLTVEGAKKASEWWLNQKLPSIR